MTRGMPIPDTVTLPVPFRVVKRGGRKEMQLPEGATQPRRADNTLVKALARAFRLISIFLAPFVVAIFNPQPHDWTIT